MSKSIVDCMELREAIFKRKTENKQFLKDPVRDEDIRALIDAANRAPSHFNSQPWDFILITDPKIRKQIGEIAGESMQALISEGSFFKRYMPYFRFSKKEISERKSGMYFDKIPSALRPFIPKITTSMGVKLLNMLQVPKILGKDQKNIVINAPMLLALLLRKEEYKPGERSGIYSLIAMGAVLQNIWLTATSLGMGLQFVSTPMEVEGNWQKIVDLLEVPDSHELMAVYRLGYTDPKLKRNTIDWVSDERRSFEDSVRWQKWGSKS